MIPIFFVLIEWQRVCRGLSRQWMVTMQVFCSSRAKE